MKLKLSTLQKLVIVFVCFAVSVTGFMLKLPAAFRHVDKELHSAFYFCAAALLNILFAKNNLIRHMTIFVILYLLGLSIEHAQAYSNKLFRTRIHGRFDPEDVKANLRGLLLFSTLWITYAAVRFVYRRAQVKDSSY